MMDADKRVCAYCTTRCGRVKAGEEPCVVDSLNPPKGHLEEGVNGISIPMILYCPKCWARHIDVGEFATKAHHTHACQHCGFVWRPAIVPTVGVQFLPGFKDQT